MLASDVIIEPMKFVFLNIESVMICKFLVSVENINNNFLSINDLTAY